jgi:hypothetical protein
MSVPDLMQIGLLYRGDPALAAADLGGICYGAGTAIHIRAHVR